MEIIDPSQCRAARALLEWTQAELAEASGVALSTLQHFENERRTPIANNLAAIRRVLEQAGVRFIAAGKSGGRGVRWKG